LEVQLRILVLEQQTVIDRAQYRLAADHDERFRCDAKYGPEFQSSRCSSPRRQDNSREQNTSHQKQQRNRKY
jgi:hypothetical protein